VRWSVEELQRVLLRLVLPCCLLVLLYCLPVLQPPAVRLEQLQVLLVACSN
jgi:hypothetical protein